jgi:very-short-patch-repair endonuclease
MMRGPSKSTTHRARSLRADQPSAERTIWRRLRNRQLNGFKFVRQEAIGPFFGDFVCRAERLVIEIDGATHSSDEERVRDARRKAFLRAEGFRVLRFTNAEVYGNCHGVMETILAVLERRQTL